MLDCTIIIPVFNHAALTAQCLDTLLASRARGVTFEVVVVDDKSTDGTPELLARYHDRIRVVTRTINRGFATSCNDGARSVGALFDFPKQRHDSTARVARQARNLRRQQSRRCSSRDKDVVPR